jgi:tetraacyldisaccharide 4'-kinase
MKLQTLWYQQRNGTYPIWYWLLYPLQLVFWGLSALRRYLFKIGMLSSRKPDVPIIIVGNITVGGNGKTPLALLIAQIALNKGKRPGVLSRGYGGNQTVFPYRVCQGDTADKVGDEPLLIASRLDIPVVIDPKRTRGADYLVDHCDCNVIICDDGLQHYALQRSFEIVVMDSRGAGNQRLLPMGPLREGIWRLSTVDMLVRNIGVVEPASAERDKLTNACDTAYDMTLKPSHWVNVRTHERLGVKEFEEQILSTNQQKVTAIAGIGSPSRFFDTLKQLRITPDQTLGFDDHYQYSDSDLPDGLVLMTEKDAVKCRAFNNAQHWYLEVSAVLPQTFESAIDAVLTHTASPNN